MRERRIYIGRICIDSKMAAIKSQSKRSEDHMMETRKLARKSARLTKKKPEETGEKKDGDSEVPPSRENDCGNECEVRCFCNSQRETGEMVQCEVCAGWFHLECLRMKEGVGVLDGRGFCLLFLSFCESVRIDKVGW